MKTRRFRILSVAALALTALSAPGLAHDGYFYGRHYGRPHFVFPSQRVVIVRPPVFVPRPVVVYLPGPVYYAPAPAYYAQPFRFLALRGTARPAFTMARCPQNRPTRGSPRIPC